jgi:hypothetical protein
MTQLLSDSERNLLEEQLEHIASSQMTDSELAAFFGYSYSRFQEILNAYPEFAEKKEQGKILGQANLRATLWNKGMELQNIEALKLLAAEYLHLGKEKGDVKAERLNVGPEKLRKIHDILTDNA